MHREYFWELGWNQIVESSKTYLNINLKNCFSRLFVVKIKNCFHQNKIILIWKHLKNNFLRSVVLQFCRLDIRD